MEPRPQSTSERAQAEVCTVWAAMEPFAIPVGEHTKRTFMKIFVMWRWETCNRMPASDRTIFSRWKNVTTVWKSCWKRKRITSMPWIWFKSFSWGHWNAAWTRKIEPSSSFKCLNWPKFTTLSIRSWPKHVNLPTRPPFTKESAPAFVDGKIVSSSTVTTVPICLLPKICWTLFATRMNFLTPKFFNTRYKAAINVINKKIHRSNNHSIIFFLIFFNIQKQANGGKFKLRDLLSVPMQRVLKYHLLLHELLRQTPDTMPDAQNSIRTAYEHMLDLGQFINEVKRDAETLQIIADIQRSITDLKLPEQTQLQDYGRLVRDGELKVRSQDDHKLRQRYVFVFDKVLLMCKAMRGEQYSYRQALVLLDYELFEQLPPPLIGLLGGGSSFNVMTGGGLTGSLGSNGEKQAFFLVHQLQHHVFTFYAKTGLWAQTIRTAMETVCPPVPGAGGNSSSTRACVHSYIITTFDNPSYCDQCARLLKGKFFQGYRCVLCAGQVHKSCIAQSGRCGPPQLPPRQPTTNSPQPAGSNLFADRTTQRLNQSLCSLSQSLSADPAYVNLRLESYPWFAGLMDREYAHRTLKQLPHGSFLVRISCKQRGSFALSINDAGEVKHMRIVRTENNRYFLSQSKCFDSILQLVRWYEQHSLAESFVGLNITLTHPYRNLISPKQTPSPVLLPSAELFSVMNSANLPSSTNGTPVTISSPTSNCSSILDTSTNLSKSVSGHQELSGTSLLPISTARRLENGSIDLSSSNGATSATTAMGLFAPVLSFARALYRFTGDSPSMLSFQKGDQVEVLSKAGEKKGWWKGRIGNRIGYFPFRYVTELEWLHWISCVDLCLVLFSTSPTALYTCTFRKSNWSAGLIFLAFKSVFFSLLSWFDGIQNAYFYLLNPFNDLYSNK